jgi:hypothetical protein
MIYEQANTLGAAEGELTIGRTLEGLGDVHQVHRICLDAIAPALNLQGKVDCRIHAHENITGNAIDVSIDLVLQLNSKQLGLTLATNLGRLYR